MFDTKYKMTKKLLEIKELFEHNINNNNHNVLIELINNIYNSRYTFYDKHLIDYIISSILNKSFINEYERNILITIIEKIKKKNNNNNSLGIYLMSLIRIVNKVTLLHKNNERIKVIINNIVNHWLLSNNKLSSNNGSSSINYESSNNELSSNNGSYFSKFYSRLTKKIQKLNTNINNKWQLHIFNSNRISISSNNPISFKNKKILVKQTIAPKPSGIWTSGLYGSGSKNNFFWSNWLESEKPNWGDPKKSRFFILKFDKSSILQINTIDKFDIFRKKYIYQKERNKYPKDYVINWIEVAKEYKGINITPYQWNRRENEWYYTWDCASQCVWDYTAITDVQELDVSGIL